MRLATASPMPDNAAGDNGATACKSHDLIFQFFMQSERVFKGHYARVRAQASGHKARRGLRETQGRFGVHLVVQRSDEAGIEGVAAASRVDHLDVVGAGRQARAVLVGVDRRHRRQA